MSKKAVISISGGMDSTGLLLNLLNKKDYDEVYALSFDYGQKHKVELKRVNSNIKYLRSTGYNVNHKVVNLSSIMCLYYSALTTTDFEVPEGHYNSESMKQTVVPNRNAIFSSLIYGYALSIATKYKCEVDIALGVHSGDHAIYPDCRPEFYDAIYHAFTIGNWESERVKMYLPYLNSCKFDILKDAEVSCKNLNLKFKKVFKNTNTCYKPDDKGQSCGKCGSCTERLEAFEKLGVKDPVRYA